jgi:hypothetical protein
MITVVIDEEERMMLMMERLDRSVGLIDSVRKRR